MLFDKSNLIVCDVSVQCVLESTVQGVSRISWRRFAIYEYFLAVM